MVFYQEMNLLINVALYVISLHTFLLMFLIGIQIFWCRQLCILAQFVVSIVWEVNDCMQMKGPVTGMKYFHPKSISFHKYNTNVWRVITIKDHLPCKPLLAVTLRLSEAPAASKLGVSQQSLMEPIGMMGSGVRLFEWLVLLTSCKALAHICDCPFCCVSCAVNTVDIISFMYCEVDGEAQVPWGRTAEDAGNLALRCRMCPGSSTGTTEAAPSGKVAVCNQAEHLPLDVHHQFIYLGAHCHGNKIAPRQSSSHPIGTDLSIQSMQAQDPESFVCPLSVHPLVVAFRLCFLTTSPMAWCHWC